MAKGRLIVLEGAEGVGKSSQAARLRDRLTHGGMDVELIREPGGTPVGEQVRDILLSPGRELVPASEALLFMASRAAVTEERIKPAIARGATVVADRFFLSTYAYQIAGRGLPEAGVRAANQLATGGLVPDLVLLLELPLDIAMERARARGTADRIEAATESFHRRVASAFGAFVTPEWQAQHPESGPVLAIDGSGSPDMVENRIFSALRQRFPETFRS